MGLAVHGKKNKNFSHAESHKFLAQMIKQKKLTFDNRVSELQYIDMEILEEQYNLEKERAGEHKLAQAYKEKIYNFEKIDPAIADYLSKELNVTKHLNLLGWERIDEMISNKIKNLEQELDSLRLKDNMIDAELENMQTNCNDVLQMSKEVENFNEKITQELERGSTSKICSLVQSKLKIRATELLMTLIDHQKMKLEHVHSKASGREDVILRKTEKLNSLKIRNEEIYKQNRNTTKKMAELSRMCELMSVCIVEEMMKNEGEYENVDKTTERVMDCLRDDEQINKEREIVWDDDKNTEIREWVTYMTEREMILRLVEDEVVPPKNMTMKGVLQMLDEARDKRDRIYELAKIGVMTEDWMNSNEEIEKLMLEKVQKMCNTTAKTIVNTVGMIEVEPNYTIRQLDSKATANKTEDEIRKMSDFLTTCIRLVKFICKYMDIHNTETEILSETDFEGAIEWLKQMITQIKQAFVHVSPIELTLNEDEVHYALMERAAETFPKQSILTTQMKKDMEREQKERPRPILKIQERISRVESKTMKKLRTDEKKGAMQKVFSEEKLGKI